MRHLQSVTGGLGTAEKVKKPGLQEWEATFTRTHLSDAIRAQISKARKGLQLD